MVRLLLTAPLLALWAFSGTTDAATTTRRHLQDETAAPSENGTNEGTGEDIPALTDSSFATVSPTEPGTSTSTAANSLPGGETFASVAPLPEDEQPAAIVEEEEPPKPVCLDNPSTFAVAVDVQSVFADDATEAAGCDAAEQAAMDQLISATLNSAFSKATNWNGGAVFGDVTVDAAQQKTNRQFTGNRRNLRQLQQKNSDESVCFARAASECKPNHSDLCRWSCLEVDTTYCGDSMKQDLKEFASLGDSVKYALATLRGSDADSFGCLGVLNDLEVVVKVDPDASKLQKSSVGNDGIDGEVDARIVPTEDESPSEEESSEEETTTEAPPSTPAPPTLAEVILKHEEILATVPETCSMIQNDPCVHVDKNALEGQTFDIQSSLAVKFFTQDIPSMDILDAVAAPWFEQILRDSKLEKEYVECSLRIDGAKSNFEPSTGTLTVTFDTRILMDDKYKENDKTLAETLTGDQVDFKEYLDELHTCGVWLSEIEFDLTGTSRRR